MNTELKVCFECDKGRLHPKIYNDDFRFNGKELRVSGLKHSLCDACGAEPILPNQISFNQVLITDAKRETLGLLTSGQIKAIRKGLGLSQREASEFFGGPSNAFSKYERGQVIQSESTDILLRVVSKFPFVASHIADLKREPGTLQSLKTAM